MSHKKSSKKEPKPFTELEIAQIYQDQKVDDLVKRAAELDQAALEKCIKMLMVVAHEKRKKVAS